MQQQKRTRVSAALFVVVTVVTVVTGGGCPAQNAIPAADPPQCTSTGITAFDPAHHALQDAQVAAHARIVELLEDGAAAPATAAAKVEEARSLYLTTAGLRDEVLERTDDRLAERPLIGDRLDATITASLDGASTATDARALELAAEVVDKAFVEFLFLSVMHELLENEAEGVDEALGYLGTGPDNDVDGLLGFAAVARRRDVDYGTGLEPALFDSLRRLSCAFATAAGEGDEVDVLADERTAPHVADIDVLSRRVMALSMAHEAHEIEELQQAAEGADASALADIEAEAHIKLVELDGFFVPLERLWRSEGGAAAADAVRSSLDAALAAPAGWLDAFDVTVVFEATQDAEDLELPSPIAGEG